MFYEVFNQKKRGKFMFYEVVLIKCQIAVNISRQER